VTREDYYNPDLDPEVLERRRGTADMLLNLSGITFLEQYVPGIVTLNSCVGLLPELPDRKFILVAWKIDDAAWKIRTIGQWRISDNDPDAHEGLTSFVPDSWSWAWGMHPTDNMDEAVRLRDRIVRLTREYGLEIDSFEADITLRD
jgi:hypothetical protein